MKALSIGNFNPFWKKSILVATVASWSLPIWNVVVNPYQVFNQNLSIGERYESSTTNERYLKVKHLLSEHAQTSPDSHLNVSTRINRGGENIPSTTSKISEHDAFLVGSSIMGLVDPALANRYFPGRNFYNLAFLAAKPDEILATLKALKKGGVPIKNVVYGLEPIAFTDIKSYGPAYQLHYDAVEKPKLRILFDFLFAPSFSDGFSRLVNIFRGMPSVRYDIEGSGRYHLERYDREIENDHEAFIKKQFPADKNPVAAPPWINDRFEDLKALVRWLNEEKINARFYLNPLHPYVHAAYGESRLREFKQKIIGLTGNPYVKDCTELLNDGDVNLHFYDYKHFLPDNAKAVIECGLGVDILPSLKEGDSYGAQAVNAT
jgi:hypothetical protein